MPQQFHLRTSKFCNYGLHWNHWVAATFREINRYRWISFCERSALMLDVISAAFVWLFLLYFIRNRYVSAHDAHLEKPRSWMVSSNRYNSAVVCLSGLCPFRATSAPWQTQYIARVWLLTSVLPYCIDFNRCFKILIGKRFRTLSGSLLNLHSVACGFPPGAY